MDVMAIDRVVLATSDLTETRARFESLLGLSFSEPQTATTDDHVRVSYSHPGLELIEPRSAETPVWSFLEDNGPGVWGLVFRVASLDEAVSELRSSGVEPVAELDIPEAPEAMYHPSEFGGVLTILTAYPHPLER